MKAMIIEDEVRNQRMLDLLIETHCPTVKVVGFSERVNEAIQQINELRPDLIFLDIQLKDGSGFDILSRLDQCKPKVIFTTAYDQYAIKAFKYSAVDYLLKPIITDELKSAVAKVSVNQSDQLTRIQNLLDQLNLSKEEYLTISTQKSTEYLRISEILRFEAQGAYCKIYMLDNSSHVISKVLKDFVLKFQNRNFFRVHQSHLINLNYVKSFHKRDQSVLMTDGAMVSVSRQKKDDFVKEMARRSVG